ncbi:MAG: DUF192 domain-containing protein [Candidatus Pacearchaeota archaeon]
MKIKKRNSKLIVILTILILIFFIGYFMYYITNIYEKNSKKVCISNKSCFNVEVVSSPKKMEIGLSHKRYIKNDSGMLFVFPREVIPNFWMKDMNFPIDIIWISKDLRVIGIEKNLQPCLNEVSCPLVSPDKEVMYVLEINAGLSDLYGFKVYDPVYFQ